RLARLHLHLAGLRAEPRPNDLDAVRARGQDQLGGLARGAAELAVHVDGRVPRPHVEADIAEPIARGDPAGRHRLVPARGSAGAPAALRPLGRRVAFGVGVHGGPGPRPVAAAAGGQVLERRLAAALGQARLDLDLRAGVRIDEETLALVAVLADQDLVPAPL